MEYLKSLEELTNTSEHLITIVATAVGLLTALIYLLAALLGRKKTIVRRDVMKPAPNPPKMPQTSSFNLFRSFEKALGVLVVGVLGIVLVGGFAQPSHSQPLPSPLPAGVAEIVPGQTAVESLSGRDLLVNGAFADDYAFRAVRGRVYYVTMRSPDFFVALYHLDASGNLYPAIPYSPAPGAIQLTIQSPQNGWIYVRASSTQPGIVGRYQLELVEQF